MKITVKSIRKNCGYSIGQMAESLGICPKIYDFYEKHPWLMPVDVALKISNIGKISIDYIFFG